MKVRMLIVLGMLIVVACGQPATSTPPVGSMAASSAPAGSSPGGTAMEPSLTMLATTNIQAIDGAVDTNDAAAAKAAFEAFHEGWEAVEDGVKERSAASYTAIEAAMEQVEDVVVRAPTLNAAEAKAATAHLRTELETFVSTLK